MWVQLWLTHKRNNIGNWLNSLKVAISSNQTESNVVFMLILANKPTKNQEMCTHPVLVYSMETTPCSWYNNWPVMNYRLWSWSYNNRLKLVQKFRNCFFLLFQNHLNEYHVNVVSADVLTPSRPLAIAWTSEGQSHRHIYAAGPRVALFIYDSSYWIYIYD